MLVSIFGQTTGHRIYTVSREPIRLPQIQYLVFGNQYNDLKTSNEYNNSNSNINNSNNNNNNNNNNNDNSDNEIKAVRPQGLLGCAVYQRCDGVCPYLNLVYMLRPHVVFTWLAVQFNL